MIVLLSVLFSLVLAATALLRWRTARLYWHSHEGGSRGYRNDCLLLAAPLLFVAVGAAIAADLAPAYGLAVFLFIAPVALAGTVSLLLMPIFRRASLRLMQARAPLEQSNVR